MVRVTIRLYGELRSRDSNRVILDVNEKTKIFELFKKLELSQEEVFVTLVNGQAHNFEQTLVEGDQVDIFPTLTGG